MVTRALRMVPDLVWVSWGYVVALSSIGAYTIYDQNSLQLYVVALVLGLPTSVFLPAAMFFVLGMVDPLPDWIAVLASAALFGFVAVVNVLLFSALNRGLRARRRAVPK